MFWSEYLGSQPNNEAEALVIDLALGFGTLSFMMRQLTRNGELREVVATLGRAECVLDRAYRRLALMPEWTCCHRSALGVGAVLHGITDGGMPGPHNLFAPLPGPRRVHGSFSGRRVSLYTAARLHPRLALTTGAAVGALIGAWQVRRTHG